jgi:hypothetical protein
VVVVRITRERDGVFGGAVWNPGGRCACVAFDDDVALRLGNKVQIRPRRGEKTQVRL